MERTPTAPGPAPKRHVLTATEALDDAVQKIFGLVDVVRADEAVVRGSPERDRSRRPCLSSSEQ